MWAGFHPQPITADYYHEQLGIAFGDAAEDVAAQYPVGTYATPGLAWATVVTDRVWACPAQAELRHYAAVTPTFAYYFDDREAPRAFPGAPEIPLGAYHGAELTYLFGDARFDPSNRHDADQRELSSQMIQYWSDFARSGDPNGPDLPAWEPFEGGDPAPFVQRLAPGPDGLGPVDVIAEHRCDFWADLTAAD